MKCRVYERHWLDEISAKEFAAHCETCAECRRAAAHDEMIEKLAGELEPPAPTADGWAALAARLEAAGTAARPARRRIRFEIPVPRRLEAWAGWQVAAALVVVIGLGSLLALQPWSRGPQPRNILAEDALQRVESLEAQYVAAIADLETVTGPLIAAADNEILLRYRQRLEVIDAQIRRCRAVLAADNANAHARRYLLAAYQDKTETLTELLESSAG